MDTIVVIVMGIVLSAFAVGEGYLARWGTRRSGTRIAASASAAARAAPLPRREITDAPRGARAQEERRRAGRRSSCFTRGLRRLPERGPSPDVS